MPNTIPLEFDPDVARALHWFENIGGPSLRMRVAGAREHYRQKAAPSNVEALWPDPMETVLAHDKSASLLAQVDALLRDRYSYDPRLAARIIPFVKVIGMRLPDFQRVPGASDRVEKLVSATNSHPDGTLFELATAARYAREGYKVEFIPEATSRTADFRFNFDGIEIHVECKRLQRSHYESLELAKSRALFVPMWEVVHDRQLSIHVDVIFTEELSRTPEDYLLTWIDRAANTKLWLPSGYEWSDEFGRGVVRKANIRAVEQDTQDSSLFVGPKMARLLTGKVVSEGSYQLAISGQQHSDDRRFVDQLRYGSVFTWQCVTMKSIVARARYIKSLLADIDRQVANANIAIAHLGMEAERDSIAADLRRDRNKRAVLEFRSTSRLAEIELHYFLPWVAERSSWVIDETVDMHSAFSFTLLDDPRILGGEDLSPAPGWHQPPPPFS
jgi:hypothetical protein